MEKKCTHIIGINPNIWQIAEDEGVYCTLGRGCRTDFAEIQNEKNVEVTDNGKDNFCGIGRQIRKARFVDFRGIEHDRVLKFKNSRGGFETILARIRDICKEENFATALKGKFH